jgi:hypothetical protein
MTSLSKREGDEAMAAKPPLLHPLSPTGQIVIPTERRNLGSGELLPKQFTCPIFIGMRNLSIQRSSHHSFENNLDVFALRRVTFYSGDKILSKRLYAFVNVVIFE